MCSHIFESAISPVTKQAILQRLERQRAAIIRSPSRRKTLFRVRKAKVNVAANKQVQPAVSVIVYKSRTTTPAWSIGSALPGNIGKCAITVVSPHLIVAEIRDIQIYATVIVEISGGDSHAIAESVDSRLCS